jgi:riboflavin synthase
MFTGIVQKTGEVREVDTTSERGRLVVRAEPWATPYEPGESIAINGVCLTLVAAHPEGDLRFDVLRETFRLTNLGSRRPGQKVNLERALRLGDALGGHYVTGHVDGVGRVERLSPIGADLRVEIRPPPHLLPLLVLKGSITCDGISLTVAELGAGTFAVHLIPHTLALTAWHDLGEGAVVNLEADLFAKQVKRLADSGSLPRRLTWERWRSLEDSPRPE